MLKFGLADKSQILQLKDIWKTVFGDTQPYSEMFFEHRYPRSRAMVAAEGDRVVSMLLLLPLTAVSGKERFDASYIYAVSTLPQYRSRGISSELLDKTHSLLRLEGAALSLLVPASDSLFDFYACRGFEEEFFLDIRMALGDPSGPKFDVKQTSLTDMLQLRNRYFSQSQLFCEWDKPALGYQDIEASAMGGRCLMFSEAACSGYALCYPTTNGVLVKEFAGNCDLQKAANTISACFDDCRITFRLPAASGGARYAMAKWYCQRPEMSGKFLPYFSLGLD